MSLLSIVQNAMGEIGFPVPATVIGNTDQLPVQALRLLNREGETLSRYDWEALREEHTFTLVTSTQTYSLPADFRYIKNSTSWNRDNKRTLVSPLTAEEWQFFKGWSTVNSLNMRARIRNGLYEFEQDIVAADNGKTIAFEYVSKYWVEDVSSTAKGSFTVDSDTSLLDEELLTQGLVWRLRKAKGLEWQSDYAEYNMQVKQAQARDGGSRKLRLNEKIKHHLGVNTPEGNYG